MSKYVVRLKTNDKTRAVAIMQLRDAISAVDGDVKIIESGRSAYTVDCADNVLSALTNSVRKLAEVDRYQGLNPL